MNSSDGGGNPPVVDEIAFDVLRFGGIGNMKFTSNDKRKKWCRSDKLFHKMSRNTSINVLK